MAQFDSLIIFVIISSLILILIFHYDTLIGILIPGVTETKKFTEKKTLAVPRSFTSINTVGV